MRCLSLQKLPKMRLIDRLDFLAHKIQNKLRTSDDVMKRILFFPPLARCLLMVGTSGLVPTLWTVPSHSQLAQCALARPASLLESGLYAAGTLLSRGTDFELLLVL